jgi:hypothetical protein
VDLQCSWTSSASKSCPGNHGIIGVVGTHAREIKKS